MHDAVADETMQPQDPAAGSATAEPTASADPIEALMRENTELKDRVLRTLAEMENLRRRTEREVADGRVYAVTALARDTLAIADNIRRALQSLTPEWRASADAGGQALADGVELTERELLKVLERHGVKKVEAENQKFDPNLHQAMYEVPDQSVPAGTVVQVLQDGFTIGDRILRPAMVGVSKGGPRMAPTEPSQGNG
jgi:molecular chaperone GrpE